MSQIQTREDTFSVMAVTIGIVLVIIFFSIFFLWLLTKDIYLDSYFTLEAFFEAQNTAASTTLAGIAYSSNIGKFLPIFVIVVIDNLSRILIVSFILAAVIDFLNFANIEEFINELRTRLLRRHIIMCGYTSMTNDFIGKLNGKGMRYVVVEPNVEKCKSMNGKKILNISQDFTKENSLRLAGIDRADTIIFASENDVDNVVGAIVARKLSRKIKIVSRLKDEHTRKKVYSIGVDMAVIPENLAGLEMGEFVRKAIV